MVDKLFLVFITDHARARLVVHTQFSHYPDAIWIPADRSFLFSTIITSFIYRFSCFLQFDFTRVVAYLVFKFI
jgi:hypothetical protein